MLSVNSVLSVAKSLFSYSRTFRQFEGRARKSRYALIEILESLVSRLSHRESEVDLLQYDGYFEEGEDLIKSDLREIAPRLLRITLRHFGTIHKTGQCGDRADRFAPRFRIVLL